MRKFLIIFLLALSYSADAQTIENFELKFRAPELQVGQKCVLAYHFGMNQYIKDSLVVKTAGEVTYTGTGVEPGLYMLVLPSTRFLEFIVNEPVIEMETSLSSPVEHMNVIKSQENKVFFEYVGFIAERRMKKKSIQNQLKTDPGNKKLQKQLSSIEDEVNEKVLWVVSHQDLFVGKMILASTPPNIPDPDPSLSEKEQQDQRYLAYKNSYFDHFDLNDPAFLRTNLFESRIKEFFDQVIIQHPDSAIIETDKFLSRVDEKYMFQFALITVLNYYANTKKMCFDKVYVHMVEKYYLTGKAWWATEPQLKDMKERYSKMKHVTCGSQAVSLVLKDLEGVPRSLYEIPNDWTLVFFWDDECNNCAKTIDSIKAVLKENPSIDIEVYSIDINIFHDKWKKKVEEKGIEDWINVADLEYQSNFRHYYDIQSTPMVFLLNKNKEIVAKRFNISHLPQLVKELGPP